MTAYLDLPFVIRLFASFLLSAFIGSAIMAFLSTYANYLFAFRHGARIPVEGVPFLSLSVATASFLIFVVSGLAIGALYVTIRGLSFVIRITRPPQKEDERRVALITIAATANLPTVAWFLLDLSFLDIYIAFKSHDPEYLGHLYERRRSGAIGTIIGLNLTVIALAFHMFPLYANRITRLLYVVVTAAMAIGMVIPGVYDSFLRLGRFGGGIEITLTKKDENSLRSHLFLLTERRVILYDSAAKVFLEVPADDVTSISYELHPNWELPKTSVWNQLKYVK